MRTLLLLLMLAAAQAAAQRPWEQRVDLPVSIPIELPSVPPTNPFATPVDGAPALVTTPLVEEFEGTFPVAVAAYLDAQGACQRAVVTTTPFPGVAQQVATALEETRFTPGLLLDTAVPTWIVVGVDLAGRLEEGTVSRVSCQSPDPAAPPQPDASSPFSPEARDLQLPATPAEQLSRVPAPKRFRVRVPSQVLTPTIRLLAEVNESGRVSRVVYLSCPEGLQRWLLVSLGSWTFRPAQRNGRPVTAWALLEGELEVEVGTLVANGLRVKQQAPFPPTRPPGGSS